MFNRESKGSGKEYPLKDLFCGFQTKSDWILKGLELKKKSAVKSLESIIVKAWMDYCTGPLGREVLVFFIISFWLKYSKKPLMIVFVPNLDQSILIFICQPNPNQGLFLYLHSILNVFILN